MEIVHDVEGLRRYMRTAVVVSGTSPVLIDRFLRSDPEIDVDDVAAGTDVFTAGVWESIEAAGIYSGVSDCSQSEARREGKASVRKVRTGGCAVIKNKHNI